METQNINYKEKLDSSLSGAMKAWWDSLTKEELLAFIGYTEAFTADTLRQLFASEDIAFMAQMVFSTKNKNAATNFNAGSESRK